MKKGVYEQLCARTSCGNGLAIWYNHSTKQYYCPHCAERINKENHKEAMELFGHELCTRGRPM